MALDYLVFKPGNPGEEPPRSQNYFQFNAQLQYLIRRHESRDPELAEEILRMVGAVSAQTLAPHAAANDAEGCRLEWRVGEEVLDGEAFPRFIEWAGVDREPPDPLDPRVRRALAAYREDPQIRIVSDVVLPPGAAQQIRHLREQNLFGMALPEALGGSGLSPMVASAALMMVAQADAALFLRVMLTDGVADLIRRFAEPPLPQRYVPLLCSSDLEHNAVGAMAITEPNAGSDLRGIAVQAVQKGGRYYLNGCKIFLTNPDADVTLVLARLDGAPRASLEGLSLFLVPKWVKEDHGDRHRNRMVIENLEHKLGIRASPTGTLRFKGAEAYLIGREGDGLKPMLYLMNQSRLNIGLQGVGIAERGFLESAAYALERRQFGKPLVDLPLMQDLLVSLRMENEAAASLIFKACRHLDRAGGAEADDSSGVSETGTSDERDHARRLVRILTPLAKVRGSSLSVWAADQAVSHFGGYGYINEFPVERLLRDAKITTLYEGTNNMMVLDVQRSIRNEDTLTALAREVTGDLQAVRHPVLRRPRDTVGETLEQVRRAYATLAAGDDAAVATQGEAGRFADRLIRVVEAAALLEEAQHQIDQNGDWRKAVLAMKYVEDHLLPWEQRGPAGRFGVVYFRPIFYGEPLPEAPAPGGG